MLIESRNINQLSPNEKNPRNLSKKAIDAVKKSIESFGYLVPIVIDENNVVLAGHTRLRAVKNLGWKEVDCVVVSNLTEEEKKIFNIVDNKTTELNSWDEELLASLLSTIKEDMTQYGFSNEELDSVFKEESEEEDDIPEKNDKVDIDIKVGDIFQLGKHRLICGDSQDVNSYKRLLEEEKVKLTFTSPPYNIGGGMYQSYTDDLKSEQYVAFNKDVIALCMNFTKGYLAWNISYNRNSRKEFIDILHHLAHLDGWRFLELVCWNKKHAIPITSPDMVTRQYEDVFIVADEDTVKTELELYSISKNTEVVFNKKLLKGITNYWEFDTSGSQLDNHKACYPVAFVSKGLVLMTDRGDAVLDPFGGSGTTMISCEKMVRKCFMIELDPVYCDVIIRRWEKYTGKRAIKLV